MTRLPSERSKAVLITGCGSGIGHATALRLVKVGWPVYATARRPDAIDDLAAAGCVTRALDVTDQASMERVVEEIQAQHGAVGVLVNNAGYSQSGPVETVPMDLVRRQFETNVFGVVRLTQLVLPAMRAQGWGRIVNISSMGGRLTFPGGGYYHATKHAIEAVSDALRFEVRNFGVRVIVVEPGLIRSRFGDAAVGTMEDMDGDGAYKEFNEKVAALTTGAYESGALAMFAGDPDAVARTIERAISATRPRARYRVTPSAKVMLSLRRMLPDRAWDVFVGTRYPRPSRDR